jgi:hypothetical protein
MNSLGPIRLFSSIVDDGADPLTLPVVPDSSWLIAVGVIPFFAKGTQEQRRDKYFIENFRLLISYQGQSMARGISSIGAV